jgi:DNA-binding CsgD family transcriptional regulator
MEVTPNTVSSHLRNLRDKLGAANSYHALAEAIRRGWID